MQRVRLGLVRRISPHAHASVSRCLWVFQWWGDLMQLVSRHQSPRGHTAQTSDDRQGMPHFIISESPPSAPSIIMTRDSDKRFYTSSSQDTVEVVLPYELTTHILASPRQPQQQLNAKTWKRNWQTPRHMSMARQGRGRQEELGKAEEELFLPCLAILRPSPPNPAPSPLPLTPSPLTYRSPPLRSFVGGRGLWG